MFKLRASLRVVTVAAMLVLGLVAVSQAVAADQPAVPIAKTADAATRAIVKADPAYVASAVCAPVTGKMGVTSSSLYINYTTAYMFSCD